MTMNCLSRRRTGLWIAIAVTVTAASMSASKTRAEQSPLLLTKAVVMTLA